jgi:hypothetical protein
MRSFFVAKYTTGEAVMQMIRIGSEYRTYSWHQGLTPSRVERSLADEARRNPEAVFNRLVNQDRLDEAEWILDNFV